MRSNDQSAMSLLIATTLREALNCEDVRSELREIIREAVTTSPDVTNRDLLTPDELCAQLSISRSKLDSLNTAGIPHVRVGSVRRYILAEVIGWLRAQEAA